MNQRPPFNREWHSTHPLPMHPSIEQRLLWHLEHARYCGCHEIPRTVREEMVRRGILPPTRQVY